MIEGDEGELADWIQERRVDIGFISRQEGQRYQFSPGDGRRDLCGSPFRPSAGRAGGRPSTSFEGAPFVTTAYVPGSDVHRVLKEHNLSPDIRFISINEFSVLSMVEQGLGVSLLPGSFSGSCPGNFVRRSNQPQALPAAGTCLRLPGRVIPCRPYFSGIRKGFSAGR